MLALGLMLLGRLLKTDRDWSQRPDMGNRDKQGGLFRNGTYVPNKSVKDLQTKQKMITPPTGRVYVPRSGPVVNPTKPKVWLKPMVK